MTRQQTPWPWPLLGALIIAYAALLGSLYFSEIRRFTPCLLCWYQRILMYPLVPLLAYALIGRLPRLSYLVLALSVVGQGVSIYHYLMQKTAWLTASTACSATGVSCALTYIDWFGVVTIPMLAMLAFMLISLCMVLYLNGVGHDGPIPFAFHAGTTVAVGVVLAVGLAAWLAVRSAAAPAEIAPAPVSAVPATPRMEAPASTVSEGQRLFTENCAVCHGPAGIGIPTLTPSLQTSTAVRDLSAMELAALIRQGIAQDDPRNQLGNVMPPAGGAELTDAELQAIIGYLKTNADRQGN